MSSKNVCVGAAAGLQSEGAHEQVQAEREDVGAAKGVLVTVNEWERSARGLMDVYPGLNSLRVLGTSVVDRKRLIRIQRGRAQMGRGRATVLFSLAHVANIHRVVALSPPARGCRARSRQTAL